MRVRDSGGPMDPRIERDLETVDRALAGEGVDLGQGGLAELALLLRDERPQAEPRWAAKLDERAAAGFPRGDDDAGGSGRRRPSWLSGGGWMVPAGALATLVLVVGVVASNNGGGNDAMEGQSADLVGAPAEQTTSADSNAVEGEALENGAAQRLDSRESAYARDAAKIAPGTDNRKVDRSTQLSLSARPEEVRDVVDEALTITRSLGGIVASSQVSETPDGATATLALTLPTRNLDAAVDQMTELADVDSLNELTDDITKPFVSAQDQVKDAEARRRELLEALGNATTDAEVEALTLQIADARREISRTEAAFDRIASKARLSDLSVTVSSNPNASDERTLGDWFDDAVDVLRGIAGVLLVAAAILIPLGLIAAITASIVFGLRRRSREKALD